METKYAVIDRNSMWGWQHSQIEPEKAEVIFIFNDFLFEKDINKWQKEGKKVIVFEHGWNSFFDYELNNQKFIADGYMALGKNTAESLARAGIPKKKILISGNPKFENLPKGENKRPIPSIIYTALHWFGERKEYNSQKLDTIIKELLPYADISVKTIADSHINIPKEIKNVWYSEVSNQSNLFRDIALGLSDYDIVLTPKESTFDFVSLLVGKKVFRIGKEEEYRRPYEQHSRNILPYTKISTDLLLQEPEINICLEDELSPSLKIEEILNWTRTLKK
jgi:hypothetical protein